MMMGLLAGLNMTPRNLTKVLKNLSGKGSRLKRIIESVTRHMTQNIMIIINA
jgi:hypothetical protein